MTRRRVLILATLVALAAIAVGYDRLREPEHGRVCGAGLAPTQATEVLLACLPPLGPGYTNQPGRIVLGAPPPGVVLSSPVADVSQPEVGGG